MPTMPTTLEQLSSLGYRLLAGSGRFHVDMSMGKTVIAQDQVGSLVTIICEQGVLSVTPAKSCARPAAQYQVLRIHQPQENVVPDLLALS